MKPAPFEYHRPQNLAEALDLLERNGEDGKILAGGQSLVPMMALRLARPKVLIDINDLSELDYVRDHDGGLAIGSLTRQRSLERSSAIAERCPLLCECMPLVGHSQTRNRGTLGGSLVHNDPAAELPAIALALDARMVVASSSGERIVSASEFFLAAYSTAVKDNEMLMEIRIPPWPLGAGWAALEMSPHHGSFAIAGVAVRLEIDSGGAATDARIALFGVDSVPRRAQLAEKQLRGSLINDSSLGEAAGQVSQEIEPYDDVQASASYRRHVAGVLVKRALRQALHRATVEGA
jgi:CO/xanthine dehydrogenase FAD-binding subunit